MRDTRTSDLRPGSAECRHSRSAADPEQIRHMARTMRREKGLVLLDPARVLDPWRREVIEQEADNQIGPVKAKGE